MLLFTDHTYLTAHWVQRVIVSTNLFVPIESNRYYLNKEGCFVLTAPKRNVTTFTFKIQITFDDHLVAIRKYNIRMIGDLLNYKSN